MAAAAFKTASLALVCAACTSIAVDQRTFENTRWRVAAINARATPVQGRYVIDFHRGEIGGQFGCNHFGGHYRVRGDIMTTTAMVMTEVACPDPAMTFESWGAAILQQPMRMSWRSGKRLTFSNGAGSIALERIP